MLTADEPQTSGGDDHGPGPYEFVLAGLGACTTMTVRMYADRKNIPLDHVSVRLSHERVHAEDCANCESKDGKLDVINRELTLKGDLDDDTRQKLIEIANKCPVSRTLTGTIEVHTTLADRDA
jgi:putative redox protein